MFTRHGLHQATATISLILALAVVTLLYPQTVYSRSVATPWTNDYSAQNLVYGASSPWDVQMVVNRPPDEVRKLEQYYPVVENHFYYDEKGSGAATVFVFENGLLVGMHYRSPQDQWVDLTYFLTNNGDYRINVQSLGGFAGYYPVFPLYGMY